MNLRRFPPMTVWVADPSLVVMWWFHELCATEIKVIHKVKHFLMISQCMHNQRAVARTRTVCRFLEIHTHADTRTPLLSGDVNKTALDQYCAWCEQVHCIAGYTHTHIYPRNRDHCSTSEAQGVGYVVVHCHWKNLTWRKSPPAPLNWVSSTSQ